mgnify:CR=1 FL=1
MPQAPRVHGPGAESEAEAESGLGREEEPAMTRDDWFDLAAGIVAIVTVAVAVWFVVSMLFAS